MSGTTATRSAVIALRDERRAMREGCAFLDEKCLLLAAAMMTELRRLDALMAELAPLRRRARQALQLALSRHGLHGLQCQPPLAAGERRVVIRNRSLLGVPLHDASLEGAAGVAPAAANPSPEARECRAAFAALIDPMVRMAAMSANLARLQAEYRRTARRVRALEDVVLPEIEGDLEAMEGTLAELEQDEALWARFGRSGAGARPR